jgi:hypothetical protein
MICFRDFTYPWISFRLKPGILILEQLFYLCWDLIVKRSPWHPCAPACRRSVWSLLIIFGYVFYFTSNFSFQPSIFFFFNFLRTSWWMNWLISSSNYTISFTEMLLLIPSTTIGKLFLGNRKRIKGESFLRLKLIFLTDSQRPLFS